MKIILIATDRIPHLGVSFKIALRALGHEVCVADERLAYTLLDRRPFLGLSRRIFGDRPSGRGLFRLSLLRTCAAFKPDLILAIKGSPLDAPLLEELRGQKKTPLVMYSSDNPFNPAVSTREMVEALPSWDVIATPRQANMQSLREKCRGKIVYLPFGYDPTLHFPESSVTEAEQKAIRSDIAFIGGCDPDRVPYLDPLAQAADLAVSLYGGYYRYTEALRKCSKGFVYGRPYRLVLSTTGVAICLVRRANADGHVMKTFEIPACGAFLLAERTDDHQTMFEEDVEAVFFTSPEELMEKARFYVRNHQVRRTIAENGYKRVTSTKNTYRDRIRELLRHIN